MTSGRVRRAYLGIGGGPRPLPPQARREWGPEGCVEIVEVAPDSPAAHAGLRAEDLIVALADTRVTSVSDVQRLMVADLIGVSVPVVVVRGGRTERLAVVPSELVTDRRA
jgi:S1-C subfamily serine protease